MSMGVTVAIRERGRNVPTYSIEDALGEEASFETLAGYIREALIATSYEVLQEELRNGFDRRYLTKVDRKFNKRVEDVNHFGRIEFLSRINISEAVKSMFLDVLKQSPFDTGLYFKSHVVTLNGRYVASTIQELDTWLSTFSPEDKDMIRITNVTPYARRLELEGITSSRRKKRVGKMADRGKKSLMKVRKPNGVYFLAARNGKNKFGNSLDIKYEGMPGGYLGIQSPLPSQPKSNGKGMQHFRITYSPKGKYKKGNYIYPSIRIKIRQGGT